ncbi:MAG: type II toxin-antitoxin system RatA family toxin [Asticcacaulis sp.]
MARFHLDRVLPYRAEDLWHMVGDVQKYPEFIPWITALRTYNPTTPAEGVTSFDADVSVGFKMLSERFSTRVTKHVAGHTIHMGLLRGPLKKLDGLWRFTSVERGTRIDFDMDMDFRNPLLNAMLKANFNLAVSKLMGVFEQRAHQLYARQDTTTSQP